MRFSLPLLLLVVLACAPVRNVFARPPAQASCPADNPIIRNSIKARLAEPGVRLQMGVPYASADRVRVLSDATDAAACQAIMEKVKGTPIDPNHVLRYGLYAADGYYFVGILIYTTAGAFAYQPGELIVLDSALNLVSSSIF